MRNLLRPASYLVAGLLVLLPIRPVVVWAGDEAAVASRVATSAPSFDARARLERVNELIEKSAVPSLVGRARWDELFAAGKPDLERAATHDSFSHALNALFHTSGISHFHYYTADSWYYWHLLSVFGDDRPSNQTEHIGAITEQIDGRWFVRGILEGSVADDLPICVGDELLEADGRAFEPIGSFRGKANKPVRLKLRRRPGLIYSLSVTPVKESFHKAVQRAIGRSIAIVDYQDQRLAYLHGWSLLGGGEEYRRLLTLQDEVDGLLLDYRDGVGGVTSWALRFLFGSDHRGQRFDDGEHWHKPVVILIADGTRSAKEIIVHQAQQQGRAPLVGTATLGHVTAVGAVRRVEPDGLLLLPGFRLALEGKPTAPDYRVERDLRYAAGADPQLERAKQILSDLICE